MAIDKGDLKTLWEYAEGELLSALIWKVTETKYSDPAIGGKKRKVSSGTTSYRIYEALEVYRNKLQALYSEWKEKNPGKEVWNFIFSPGFPRFRLPDLRGGSRKFAIASDWQQIVDECERCHQKLRQTLKKSYHNPATRKRDIERVLKETLAVADIPSKNLDQWQKLQPSRIAYEAVAWHRDHGPTYLKKKVAELKPRKQ
jgi:hypothetical protein